MEFTVGESVIVSGGFSYNEWAEVAKVVKITPTGQVRVQCEKTTILFPNDSKVDCGYLSKRSTDRMTATCYLYKMDSERGQRELKAKRTRELQKTLPKLVQECTNLATLQNIKNLLENRI